MCVIVRACVCSPSWFRIGFSFFFVIAPARSFALSVRFYDLHAHFANIRIYCRSEVKTEIGPKVVVESSLLIAGQSLAF